MNKVLYKIFLILNCFIIFIHLGYAKDTEKPVQSYPSKIKVACLPRKTFIKEDTNKVKLLHASELRSAEEDFGGLSGLVINSDNDKIYMISDRARLFIADLIKNPENQAIECLKNVTINQFRGRSTNHLNGHYADSESITFTEDRKDILVSFERHHRVVSYHPNAERLLPQKDYAAFDKKNLPYNESYESVVALKDKSIIAFPERYEIQEETLRGFHLMSDEKTLKNIHLKRHGSFWLTDLAELSNGDFVTLERSFSLFEGLNVQMRHIKRNDFLSGGVADGEVIFTMNTGDGVDNFEGLDIVYQADGTHLMYIVSDNNFSTLQKTLLLSLSYKF